MIYFLHRKVTRSYFSLFHSAEPTSNLSMHRCLSIKNLQWKQLLLFAIFFLQPLSSSATEENAIFLIRSAVLVMFRVEKPRTKKNRGKQIAKQRWKTEMNTKSYDTLMHVACLNYFSLHSLLLGCRANWFLTFTFAFNLNMPDIIAK